MPCHDAKSEVESIRSSFRKCSFNKVTFNFIITFKLLSQFQHLFNRVSMLTTYFKRSKMLVKEVTKKYLHSISLSSDKLSSLNLIKTN